MDLTNLNVRSVNLRAENDKTTYAQVTIFRNPNMKEPKLALAVFSSERKGAPLFEAPFSREWIAATEVHWEELLKECEPGSKITVVVSKRQRDQQSNMSKLVKAGMLTYGIDKGGSPYIGVTLGEGAFKFPLRTDPLYTYNEEVSPATNCRIAVRGFMKHLHSCEAVIAQAMIVPAAPNEGGGGFQRRGGGGGGGFQRRGGGGGNFGGGNGGGGGGSRDEELRDEITF